jgi:signal transduction histidine kinase/ActR/RegA family two-component response regulator
LPPVQPFEFAWQSLALLLLGLSVRDLAKDPTRRNLKVTAFFATYFAWAVSAAYTTLYGITYSHVVFVAALSVMALPYAALLVVDEGRPVPPWIPHLAGAGLVASWALMVANASHPLALPTWVLALIVPYWLAVELYVLRVLLQGAEASRGPTRNRHRLAAAGTVAFGVGAVLYISLAVVPNLDGLARDGIAIAENASLLAAGTTYYLGFQPPRFLRNWWESAHLRHHMNRVRDRAVDAVGPRPAAEPLCQAATELLDAPDALLLVPTDDGSLEGVHRNGKGDLPTLPEDAWGAEVLEGRQPALADAGADFSPAERALLQETGSSTLVAVPVTSGTRTFALVTVPLAQKPLFLSSALDAMGTLADQVSFILGKEAAIKQRERHRRERLEAEKQALEERERLKDEFLATMSHEIRTPLNSVIGMSNLLQEADLDKDLEEYVETIEASGEHLLTIIDDILDLSKIEAGHLELDPEPVRVAPLVREAVDLVGSDAAEAVDLRWNLEGDVPEVVELDPDRVRQVLLNLLSNALKYTDEGHVEVRVCRTSGEEAVGLRFEVEDTGSGIPPDDQDRIFEAFRQAEADRNGPQEGTGLGLKICRELVGLMGGIIDLESVEGEGSTFWFEVPAPVAAAEQVTEIGQEEPAAEAPLGPPAEEDRLEILVAEDDPVNQTVVTEMLDRLGHDADVVEDGKEAVEQVRHGSYDLVMMDVQMPTVDGLEATRRIRSMEGDPPSVIGLSAHASAERAREAREAGMIHYLTKPITPEDLRDAIGRTEPHASSD